MPTSAVRRQASCALHSHIPGSSPRSSSAAIARDYGWRLFAPFGFVGLAAPLTLLLGVPQAVLNLVTNVPWTKTITFHYAAIPFVAVTIASIEGVAFLVRRLAVSWARVIVVSFVLGCALATSIAWGPSPIGKEYRHGVWVLDASPRDASGRAALAMIPAGDSVSATYNLVPQLSERSEIYSFPNPWESRNFGIDGWPRRNPAGVKWIMADRAVMGPDDLSLLDRILGNGHWRVVFDRDDYVVARRIPDS